MRELQAVSQGLARARLRAGQVRQLAVGERLDLPGFIMEFTSLMPNKSPEPTPIVAGSSAVAVHVVDTAWLSFFR